VRAVLLAALLAAPPGDVAIEVARVDGDVVCSIHAQDAPAVRVLDELARRLGRDISGREAAVAAGRVTIELEERPVDQAITYALGAAGLRARLTSKTIEVLADLERGADGAALDDAAEVAYLRCLRHFPAHPGAARAELAIAEIQERRGNDAAARNHYDLLVQQHPRSDLVPEALMRSATLLQRMGRWSEAWTELSTLLSLDTAHPYAVRARLELARTSVKLGDPERAMYVLDSLDAHVPPTSAGDVAERLRARALVLVELGRPMDALRRIDQAQRLTDEAPEDLVLRARALEQMERPDEAARTWLCAARSTTGDRRSECLREATRLAFDAKDDLAVIFIERLARADGLDDVVRPWAVRSRERLTLPAEALGEETVDGELTRAEGLCEDGLYHQALDSLEPLLQSREAYAEDVQVRLLSAYARAADAAGKLDEAVGALRGALGSLRGAESRRQVLTLAGELFEGHGRFDDAIAAYQGRL
jgi:tetratricopeptide (TPR) repeat protein